MLDKSIFLKKIIQIEPSLGNEEKKELLSTIDSGWYTEAAKTKEFEKKFAKFVGSRYACVVTSGTTALYIGLKALGIDRGDEVIVPDLTFVASPNSVEMTGAKPVFVDIEPQSLNLDLSRVSSLITKRTKAIMPVDFNGRSAEMSELREIANRKGLLLIEDACHAIGCYYNNKHLGTTSDVGVFSFSTPKIITTGQGGMLVTNDKKIYERCISIKDFGRDVRKKKDMRNAFEHHIIGYNFKFTEFQAAVGIAQMRKLANRIIKKKRILRKYIDLLSNVREIEFVETDFKRITPWMADILLKTKSKKNQLIKYLEKNQIETRIFYPPIHRLEPYKNSDNRFKVSSEISDRGLWLPSSVTLTDKQLEIVCEKIKKFFS